MNLWAKTFWIITTTVVIGLGSIFAVAGTVLIDDYKALEQAGAAQDAQRVRDAVASDLADLGSAAQEVSQVATVIFTSLDANLTELDGQAAQVFYSLFVANKVDAVFARYGDPPQSIAIGFDPATLTLGPGPEGLNQTLQASPWWQSSPPSPPEGGHRGLVATPDGPYLVATYDLFLPEPLLAALSPTEAGGVSLALARKVDDRFAAVLGSRIGEDLAVTRWQDGSAATLGLDGGNDIALDRADWSAMTVRFRLDDEDGVPAVVLQMEQSRTLFRQGIDSIAFFFVASLIIAGVLLLAGLLLVRYLVTNRVHHLNTKIQQIRQGSDKGARAETSGGDEVSRLAADFNGLMDSLERRERDLVQTNEDLQSFASVVTHDLKSPLSTFALNLRLLRTQAEAQGDQKEMERIERMERQTAKMGERIDAILEYSRNRDADADMDAVALEEVVASVLDDLGADIGRTGARIRIEPLPIVRGDRERLAQVVQNLLSNAIKFAKPGDTPQIRVWSEPGRTGWAVHIEDRGVGFLPNQVDTIMKPFSRLANANGIEGHGVGLASCARILERHGGRLHAQGFPGKGARFTMLLRRADAAARAPTAPAFPPPTTRHPAFRPARPRPSATTSGRPQHQP